MNRYMRGKIKECWNCEHQIREVKTHIGKNDVLIPYCDALNMGISGVFVDCTYRTEKEQK